MKLRSVKSVIAGLILLCLLLGCKKEAPKGVIKPAEMEGLLYDYHRAKSMADELPYNEIYKKSLYMDYVFKKHKTTQAQFDSSLVWYTRHTSQLTSIYEKINKRYKEQQDGLNHLIAIRDKKPQMSLPGDSIDVWYKRKIYELTDAAATNKVKFALESDTNYKERDALVWKMRYTFLPVRGNKDDGAVMSMSIQYENDSVLNITKKINLSGMDSIVAKSDSAYRIKKFSGFVYYPGQKDKKTLLLDRIQMIRYHVPKNDSVAGLIHKDSLKSDSMELKKDINRDTLKKVVSVPSSDTATSVRKSPREMNQRSGSMKNNADVRRMELRQIKKIER